MPSASDDVARDVLSGRVRRVQISGAILAGVVFLSALTVLPAFAYSSHRARTVRLKSGFTHWREKTTTATCPASQNAQFGGFRSSGAFVRELRRIGDNRWTVTGTGPPQVFGIGTRTKKLTSNVYCGHGSVPFEVSHSKRIGRSGAVAVACPPGTVVLAGGFTSPNRGLVAVSALERIAADLWRVEAVFPKRTVLTAIAYCGDGPPPKVVQSRIQLGDWTAKRTEATCPQGSSLVFGGARVTVKPTSDPTYDWALITRMRAPTSTRWSTTGVLPSEGRRGSVTALAYCR